MLLKVETFHPKQVIILSDKENSKLIQVVSWDLLYTAPSARICFQETVVNSAAKPMNHQWLISLYKHVHVTDDDTSNISVFI